MAWANSSIGPRLWPARSIPKAESQRLEKRLLETARNLEAQGDLNQQEVDLRIHDMECMIAEASQSAADSNDAALSEVKALGEKVSCMQKEMAAFCIHVNQNLERIDKKHL